ncbi:hypothetical protein ASZ90_004458 [hydrocarbon metagenome]|uniref:Uncharacterized protein n=1 Tax=hydrocarbon metagenome TaxID=938273 RepID=A0A0W8FYD7_9ZZZZ
MKKNKLLKKKSRDYSNDIKNQQIIESAKLYAKLYCSNQELKQLTESANVNWPN